MAFDGNGTFVRLYDWTTDRDALVYIRADRMDEEMDGFATGLSTCLTKDGQTDPTADLPMAGFKHTGVADANARDQYLAVGQYVDGEINWATVGGTADAITASFTPTIPALVNGMLIGFRAGAANTTMTPTFKADGTTARTVVKGAGSALAIGDIAGSGHDVILRYDLPNTRWMMLNPATGVNLPAPINETHGSDIASAGTVNLETATGNIVDVTGTTTITAITLSEGHRRLVRFTGALTLTHGASLILPTSANITTVAGDYAEFVGYAAGVVRCAMYMRLAGTPLALATDQVTTAKILDSNVTTAKIADTNVTAAKLNSDVFTTQAIQETGSSNTVAVTPGRQHYHASASKAWVSWGVGGTTIDASYNVSSITRTGTGDYTVNFTTSFSSANYCAIAGIALTTGGSSRIPVTNTQLAGSCKVFITDTTGNKAESSATQINFIALGDQ